MDIKNILNNKKVWALMALNLALISISCDDNQSMQPNNSEEKEFETTYSLKIDPSEINLSNEGEEKLISITALQTIVEEGNSEAQAKERPVGFAYEVSAKSPFTYTLVKGEGVKVVAPENKTAFENNDTIRVYIPGSDVSKLIIIAQAAGEQEIDGFPPTHPFVRMAEYLVGATSGKFAENHDYDKQAYYAAEDAAKVCPAGYRLPTYDDVKDFITKYNATYAERHRIPSWGSDFVVFIGGEGANRAAYRYSAREAKADNKVMIIEAVYLGEENSDVTEATINKNEWWSAEGRKVAKRILPLSAYEDYIIMGVNVFFWSNTQNPDSDEKLVILANTVEISMWDKPSTAKKLPVWPIRDL